EGGAGVGPLAGLIQRERGLVEVATELPVGLERGGMELVQIDRAVNAHDPDAAEAAGGEGTAELRVRRAGDQRRDAELLGRAFDPAGKVHRVAERAVLELARTTRVAHQGGPRVDPDAEPERDLDSL